MDSQELIDKGIEINVMLLGESKVGKTSIINRYIGYGFQEKDDPTFTLFFNRKYFDYENEKIQIYILDTPGKKIFRPMETTYMKKNDAFIFVYDITNKKSFDELKFLFEKVKEIVGKLKNIIIFGNKSDLYLDEEVTEEEGKKFADEIGANFCLVSAKNNNNIEEGFNSLIDQILKSNYFEKKINILKKNRIYLQKEEKAKKRQAICSGASGRRRKLSNCERCLTCCGYIACKEYLKIECNRCSSFFCGEKKCSKETCKGCCDYIVCGLCYCCCFFNMQNHIDDRNYCCCCCHCPKEGKVSVYGK